jgi:hypothetical protein
MNKFNVKLIKNSDPLKYFEDCIEHYSYDYDTIVYMRILDATVYGIKVIKNLNE